MVNGIHSSKVIAFLENLTLTDEHSGKPFRLAPFQRQFIDQLFSKQYRRAFCLWPRGSGKTTLLAALVLAYLYLAPDGQSIYSVACDREQAALIFSKCCQMIRYDSWLAARFKINETGKKITRGNSTYQAMASSVSSKLGRAPSIIIGDEIAFWNDRRLWDNLVSAGGKRKQGCLAVCITTAGEYDPASLGFELWEYARKVQEGTIQDEGFLPSLLYADQEEDWKDETVWRKVNPSISAGYYDIEHLRAEFREAEILPSAEYRFRQFYLNQWQNNCSVFVKAADWLACKASIAPSGTCVAGLDLAASTDLASMVLLFDDGTILPFYWCAKGTHKRRIAQSRQGIDHWIRQGFIEVTPGEHDVINLDYVRERILAISNQYLIREIAVDPWNAVQISSQLLGEGLRVVQFTQSLKNYNPPTKELQTLVIQKKIKHGGNPVLDYQLSCTRLYTDANGNIRPDRESSTDSIDGVMCLLMALGRQQICKPSAYESGGLTI